jgi:hypothetical protein
MLGYFNEQLFEGADLALCFAPVNLATAANTGQWFSARGYHRFAVCLLRGAGTAADVSTITVLQGTTNSGGTTKALTTGRRRYKTDMTTAAGDTWTIDDTTTYANTYATPAAKGDKKLMIVMDYESQALDDAGGFHWVQASVDQAANAVTGVAFILFYASRHSQRTPVSTLTNL